MQKNTMLIKTPTTIFMRHNGNTIRHLESQDVSLSFWYLHEESGHEFDVRELPVSVIGKLDTASLQEADRNIHRRAIKAAVEAGHDFAPANRALLAKRMLDQLSSSRGMRP
jgi:hypothetical protein